jgi:hypothetical protein
MRPLDGAILLMVAFHLVSCGDRQGGAPPKLETTIPNQFREDRVSPPEKRAPQTLEVRDPQGRLIERHIQRGNRIEVRDNRGRLLRTEQLK